MNGKMDARLVLKKAMDVAEDDKLHYGVSAQHVQAMFKLIVKMHAEEGRTVVYRWKREKRNHTIVGKGWSGKDCCSTFLKVGKFIVLGKTKRENTVHKARMRKIKLLSTEELKLNAFACYAKGNKRIDHAIGIDVDEMGVGLIIDNGCKVKPLNILNLASRMEDVKSCYKMDLFFKL